MFCPFDATWPLVLFPWPCKICRDLFVGDCSSNELSFWRSSCFPKGFRIGNLQVEPTLTQEIICCKQPDWCHLSRSQLNKKRRTFSGENFEQCVESPDVALDIVVNAGEKRLLMLGRIGRVALGKMLDIIPKVLDPPLDGIVFFWRQFWKLVFHIMKYMINIRLTDLRMVY